jgi:3'-5' exoribonuclease
MKHRLIYHINFLQSVTLRDCCGKILDTPEFLTHPASLSHHHAYEGGLLAHTVEVCDIALGISSLTCNKNLTKPWAKHDILIAAALWHDFAKVREYYRVGGRGRHDSIDDETLPVEWHQSDYAKRIHHIPGSTIKFTLAARESGVDESVIEAIQHCILAHHGRKEWGSPVEPQTIEALVLHQSDMISAHYGATAHQPTP